MTDLDELPDIVIEDSLITLKPFKVADASIQLAGEDEEHVKWLTEKPSTIESVTSWIIRNQQSLIEDGPVFSFAIWANDNNQLVGMIEANIDYQEMDGLIEGDANVSYSLYPHARGKGYATKAVELIGSYLKTKGIKRLIIRVQPKNISSVKIAERLNFTKTSSITTKDNHILDLYTKDL